mmetsp:Transcript_16830/g.25306  ORF Transcript_16830/g.25306 Transcript_16830/m.25306 type:complete len:638 (-) Transcript_16830:128-2041(-)
MYLSLSLSSLLITVFLSSSYNHINAKEFRDLSLHDINKLLYKLQGPHAAIHSTHEALHIHLKHTVCVPLMMRITHIQSLDTYTTQRPQIVVSGEIHGDERVGPSASVFAGQLLVWAADCVLNDDKTACDRLISIHVSSKQMTWLAFLSTRRDTFILPTPNCDGYNRGVRTDGGVDPNRDFPYSRKDGNCLRSNTAKLFDALFREVTVQILVTFHGGMAAIGYEWGTHEHPRGHDTSPDNDAHHQIGAAMSQVAGGFRKERPYRSAPINSIVYPVYGGMEDWAYAAGWNAELLHLCSGEKPDRTPPPNRAITFLVETSDRKKPLSSELGHDTDVLLNTHGSNDRYGGHVPRNTRLVLSAVDLVRPYVCLDSSSPILNDVSLRNTQNAGVHWYVGGGFKVHRTWLSWHRFNHSIGALPASAWEGVVENMPPPSPPSQPHEQWLTGHAEEHRMSHGLHASGYLTGAARWSWDNPLAPSPLEKDLFTISSLYLPPLRSLHPIDRDRLRRHSARGGGEGPTVEAEFMLVAWAEVDSSWGRPGQGHPAMIKNRRLRGLESNSNTSIPLPPQTHLSNARANPDWRVVNQRGDVKVQGRQYFPSDPLIVKVQYSLFGDRIVSSVGDVKSYVTECAWWMRKPFETY